jgi:hypothetical protein
MRTRTRLGLALVGGLVAGAAALARQDRGEPRSPFDRDRPAQEEPDVPAPALLPPPRTLPVPQAPGGEFVRAGDYFIRRERIDAVLPDGGGLRVYLRGHRGREDYFLLPEEVAEEFQAALSPPELAVPPMEEVDVFEGPAGAVLPPPEE